MAVIQRKSTLAPSGSQVRCVCVAAWSIRPANRAAGRSRPLHIDGLAVKRHPPRALDTGMTDTGDGHSARTRSLNGADLLWTISRYKLKT